MALPSLRGSAAANCGAATSGTASVVLPSGILTGEIGVLVLSSSSTSATATTPAGWTLQSGPDDNSAVLRTWLYTRTMASSDSGTTLNVTLTSSRWTIGVAIGSDVTGVDSIPAVVKLTVLGTGMGLPALAPNSGQCFGILAAAAQRPFANTDGGTAPSGWTEVQDSSTSFTGASDFNVYLAWKATVSSGIQSAGTWADQSRDNMYVVLLAPSSPTGTAALAGTGTLTAGAVPSIPTTATLGGTGTLTGSVAPAISTPAALSGAGLLTVVATIALTAAAALSGTGTLSADAAPALPAAAALSGSGTLTATAVPDVPLTAGLSGSGTLTGAVVPAIADDATLSGTGTLTGAAAPAAAAAAGLSGTGSLTAAASPHLPATASLSGTGTMAATGTLAGGGRLRLISVRAGDPAQWAAAAVLAGLGSTIHDIRDKEILGDTTDGSLALGVAGQAMAATPHTVMTDPATGMTREPYLSLLHPAGAAPQHSDSFARSDRQLTNDIAPTGHVYRAFFHTGGTSLPPKIASGKYIPDGTLGSGVACILYADHVNPLRRVAAEFDATAGTTLGANVVIGMAQGDFGYASVQFSLKTSTGVWQLFLVYQDPATGVAVSTYPILATGTAAVKACDGATRSKISMVLDRATSAVTLTFPDGSKQVVADPRIVLCAGNTAGWQARVNASSDSVVEFTSITSASAPVGGPYNPPGWLSGLYLSGASGTGIVSQASPPWFPGATNTYQVIATPDTLTPAATQALGSQRNPVAGAALGDLLLRTDGKLQLDMTFAGTRQGVVSTVACPAGSNGFKAVHVSATGVVTFSTSLDKGATWSTLGTTRTFTTTGVADTAAVPIVFGSLFAAALTTDNFTGTMYGGSFANGLTRTVADGVATGGSTAFSSATLALTADDVGHPLVSPYFPPGTTIVSQTGTAGVASAPCLTIAVGAQTGVSLTVGPVTVGVDLTTPWGAPVAPDFYSTGTWIQTLGIWKLQEGSLATAATLLHTTDKGIANGVASLDGSGKVPVGQLPGTTFVLDELAAPGFTWTNDATRQDAFVGSNIAATTSGVTLVDVVADGNIDCKAGSGTYTLGVWVNGIQIGTISVAVSQTTAAAGLLWRFMGKLWVETSGVSGVVVLTGAADQLSAAGGVARKLIQTIPGVTVDLSGGFQPKLTITMQTADVANTFRVQKARFLQEA